MRARRSSTSHRGAPGPFRAARRMALLLLCGLSVATVMPAATVAQDLAVPRSSQRDPFGAHIAEASQRFGVPTALIRAIMRKESAGDVRAVSSAGARGLMQIMPGTWDDLRARWSLGHDPFDPRDNILAGTAYLRELHDRFGSPGFWPPTTPGLRATKPTSLGVRYRPRLAPMSQHLPRLSEAARPPALSPSRLPGHSLEACLALCRSAESPTGCRLRTGRATAK